MGHFPPSEIRLERFFGFGLAAALACTATALPVLLDALELPEALLV
jgi:hypothetical protein